MKIYAPNADDLVLKNGDYLIGDNKEKIYMQYYKNYEDNVFFSAFKGKTFKVQIDYAYCTDAAFGVSGMTVVNLYSGDVYLGMGKSKVSKVDLGDASDVKKLRSALSGNYIAE